ncbi:hypothetical protein [Streptomyces sp. TLI_105]|uniref:hypothetical protein n=1 Tax=Streptomyces sp. TLI_105 TaxID=1881019 RepID=UPI000895B8E6|nr:hypothetical protein [Streptomyces sp. TLI_105]SED82658.1 hypothetical protein SAMN05428939_6384 [Streptomyces sp. TLI_105]
MNLTTTARTLLAALAVTGAFLGSAGAAHAAGAASAPVSATAGAVTATAPMDGPEPVELDELGLPDLQED